MCVSKLLFGNAETSHKLPLHVSDRTTSCMVGERGEGKLSHNQIKELVNEGEKIN